MTLSVITYHEGKLPSFTGIRCYADSLISSVLDKSELTSHAMKILPLELKSQPGIPSSEIIPTTSVGFTFAGNLNVALLTYNTLSFCCSSIQKTQHPKSCLPPSLCSIANMCRSILYNYISNFATVITEQAMAEILIFGYCFQTESFKAFHLNPVIKEGKFYVNITDVDICNIECYAIGEGKKLLESRMSRNGGIFSYEIIKDIIKERESGDYGVGGFYQRAWANKGVVRLLCDNDEKTHLPMSFCGFNAYGIFLDDTHLVGLPMHCCDD